MPHSVRTQMEFALRVRSNLRTSAFNFILPVDSRNATPRQPSHGAGTKREVTIKHSTAGAILPPFPSEALLNRRNSSVPLAFAAIYLVWGSTYLGIRFAIETFPPFVMASIRFLLAGAILYCVMRFRGAPAPHARTMAFDRRHRRVTFVRR